VAVEWPLSTVHADMGLDTEQLSVRSPTSHALEELVGSPGVLVASEDFLVSSIHPIAVFTGRHYSLIISQV